MKANVSKMLRSALSMFLALAMVIGMCPAVFAAESETLTWDTLHADLHEVVDILQAAGTENGVQAAIDYITENSDKIQLYVDKAEELIAREVENLTAEINKYLDTEYEEGTTPRAELMVLAGKIEEALLDLEDMLAKEIAKQNGLLADAAAAAGTEMYEEILSAIDNCEKTIETIKAGIEALKVAQAQVNEAIDTFVAALESVREAILKLDNVVVEELNPAIENLNAVAMKATFDDLEAAAKVIEDAKDMVMIAIGLVEDAFDYAYAVAEEAAELTAVAAAGAVKAAQMAAEILEPVAKDTAAYLEGRYEAAMNRIEMTFGHDEAALKALLENLTAEDVAATAVALLAAYYSDEIAWLENQVENPDSELNQKIDELKVKLEALQNMAEDEYDRFVAEDLPVIIDELTAVYNDMMAAYEAAKAEIDAAMPGIIAAIEEAYALAVEFAANAETIINELAVIIPEFINNAIAEINKLVNQIVDAWNTAYFNATHDNYLINTDSKYVGVGDAVAVSDSYVENLYAELKKSGLPEGAYANLASADVLYAKDIASQLTGATVAGADLITIGLNNITFLQNAVAAAIDNAFVDGVYATESILDWSTVAGEWLDYEVIEPIFMEIYEGLWLYQGLDKQTAAIITAALEAYAYSAASYAVQVPALIDATRAANPYATIVLVGMYNPLDGFVVEGFDVGSLVDILVGAASVHGKAYAMLTGNAIYVDAPAVETAAAPSIQAVLKNDYSAMLPSAAGHKYIQTCIYEALGLYNPVVMRVYGAERYETALAAADTMLEVTGAEKFDTIVVATGRDYADALAGSYLAAEMNAPILLVKDSKADMVAAYIAENLAADGTVYVLGGEKAVSAATAAKLGNVVRLAGDDRYATNLAILAEAGLNGGEILVATGKNYADALSASSTDKPVLLVSSSLKEEQKTFLANSGVEKITILGGENAVSADVEAELAAYAATSRIAGEDRYETSALIADAYFGGGNGSVVVASGRDYPDALCGGALAAAAGVPVVLTKHGGITEADDYAVKAYLGVVLGGEATGITEQDIVDIFELLSADAITEVIYK